MIIYEPNRHWLKDIVHLSRSWTMQRVVRSVLWMGAGTTVFAILVLEVLHWHIKFASGALSLLGIVLSILLVFRTNSAYDRWWEGRKQWGALVNNCRNLAVAAHVMLPETDLASRRKLAVYLSNFCLVLTEHLRQGVQLNQLVHLTAEEEQLYRSKAHLPAFISEQIYACLYQAYRNGSLSDAAIINLKSQADSLLDICGACERIRKTPIPFSYSVYIKLFVSLYLLLLPLGLINELGYVTIPIVMFIAFAMVGLELMASEIEDPFGLDCNDLPTHTIAQTIQGNVFEILDQHSKEQKPVEKEMYEKVF